MIPTIAPTYVTPIPANRAASPALSGPGEGRLDGVDILVLNRGGPRPRTAAALRDNELTTAIDLLVRPQRQLIERALPGMRARKWGRIIAIGSSGVLTPLPNLAASNVGGAALSGLLKTLASEVGSDGVTCNMILPGRIDTDRVKQLDVLAAERQGTDVEAVRAGSRERIPIGRYRTVEEFGATAAFLSSQQAAHITGSQIRVDGGLVPSYQTRSLPAQAPSRRDWHDHDPRKSTDLTASRGPEETAESRLTTVSTLGPDSDRQEPTRVRAAPTILTRTPQRLIGALVSACSRDVDDEVCSRTRVAHKRLATRIMR